MTLNVAKEVAALGRMTVSELRSKHVEAFGEPTRTGNRDYLVKRIAWRLQANAHGDLSCQARRRAEELANDADLRTTAPKAKPIQSEAGVTVRAALPFAHGSRLPMAGARLTRQYKGREIVVRVLPRASSTRADLPLARQSPRRSPAPTGAAPLLQPKTRWRCR